MMYLRGGVLRRGLEWEFFRDPVYDYIPYNKQVESKVIDTVEVQRLRRIHQLQIAYLVYPGADHSRFQHSLGVMHLAGMFSDHLLSVLEVYGEEEALDGYDKDSLVEAVRVAGVLHDVGHGPYSHAFEEAVLMSDSELKAKGLGDHEGVTLALVEHSEISDILEKQGKAYGFQELKEITLMLLSGYSAKMPPVIRLLQKTLKNWVYPADIMDFLLRDSYYTGTKEYGTIDYYRLIMYSYPLMDLIVLDEKAFFTLKNFLQSRTHMFESVYLHPICRSFDHLVQEMMKSASEYLGLKERVLAIIEDDSPESFLELDDYSILYMIWRGADSDPGVRRAKELLKDLLSRRVRWKPIGPSREIRYPSSEAPFFLKYSIVEHAGRDLEARVRELLIDVGMGDVASEFWVDHSLKRTLPALPYPLECIKLAKRSTSGIYITREVPFPQLLEESGLAPRVTFTVFGPSELLKDAESRRKAEAAVRQAMAEVLAAVPGITM